METENFSKSNPMNNEAPLVVLETKDTISILCNNPNIASSIYEEIKKRGFGKEDINLAMSEETHKSYFSDKEAKTGNFGSKALEGLGVGSAIGGTIGALGAAIAAIGSELVIPALGIVVAGAWAAGFAGAGAGSATGGLIGALIGLGITDDQARLLEDGINKGGIVIGVKIPADDKRQKLFRELIAYQNNRSFDRVA